MMKKRKFEIFSKYRKQETFSFADFQLQNYIRYIKTEASRFKRRNSQSFDKLSCRELKSSTPKRLLRNLIFIERCIIKVLFAKILQKKAIPFLMGLCLLTALGCDRDKVLDIKPHGLEIPETVDDFKPLIDGLYLIQTYNIDLFMADELKVLDGTINDYKSKIFINALTWEKYFTNLESTNEDKNWNKLYKGIFNCNTVLEEIEDPKISGDKKMRAKLIAEAKVHRAFFHFSLVNLYAKQYDPASAAASLGIPVRTSTKRSSLKRWSVQDTYDFILQDLAEAANSHALAQQPDSEINKMSPSMAAVYGMMARVYLQMGKYKEALQAANHSLALYPTLIDYTSLSHPPTAVENPEVLWFKMPLAINISTDLWADDELLSLYTKEDARLDIIYKTTRGSKEKVFPPSNFYINFRNLIRYVGVSTGEMYLIRAECNARLGKLDLVAADLNTLRAKRIHNYIPLAVFTQPAQALSFVKEERRRELAGRGLRLFDLKRYNALDNDQISITHMIDGVAHVLPYNSNRWICPIPRGIIHDNPEIEQSPR